MTKSLDEPSTSFEPYKTSDTPFAAYLHYSGYKLIGSVQDPNDYKREVLVFLYEDTIPDFERAWRLGEGQGDFKKFHRSLKIVTKYINEQRRKREN